MNNGLVIESDEEEEKSNDSLEIVEDIISSIQSDIENGGIR